MNGSLLVTPISISDAPPFGGRERSAESKADTRIQRRFAWETEYRHHSLTATSESHAVTYVSAKSHAEHTCHWRLLHQDQGQLEDSRCLAGSQSVLECKMTLTENGGWDCSVSTRITELLLLAASIRTQIGNAIPSVLTRDCAQRLYKVVRGEEALIQRMYERREEPTAARLARWE